MKYRQDGFNPDGRPWIETSPEPLQGVPPRKEWGAWFVPTEKHTWEEMTKGNKPQLAALALRAEYDAIMDAQSDEYWDTEAVGRANAYQSLADRIDAMLPHAASPEEPREGFVTIKAGGATSASPLPEEPTELKEVLDAIIDDYPETAKQISALFDRQREELEFDDSDVLQILCRAFDDGADEGMEEWRAWYKPTAWLSPQRALGAFIRTRIDRQTASLSSQLERQREEYERARALIIEALEALDPVVPWEARNHGESVAQRIEYVKAQLERLKAEQLTPEEAKEVLWHINGGIHLHFTDADHDVLVAKLRRATET